MPKNPNLEIPVEDVEKMRDIVAQHDAHNTKNIVHDLHNPPKVAYNHQAFPKMVYAPHYDHVRHGHPDSIPHEIANMVRVVNSAEELDAALAQGYSLQPPQAESDESPAKSEPKPVVHVAPKPPSKPHAPRRKPAVKPAPSAE